MYATWTGTYQNIGDVDDNLAAALWVVESNHTQCSSRRRRMEAFRAIWGPVAIWIWTRIGLEKEGKQTPSATPVTSTMEYKTLTCGMELALAGGQSGGCHHGLPQEARLSYKALCDVWL